jgi:fructose-bisphosphate aldolase class II
MPELLADALEGSYAVGYFESWDSYSLEAVVEAAGNERSPVILGIGCMMADSQWLEDGGITTLGALALTYAARMRMPAAVLLNEARNWAQIEKGLETGFNAIMLDTSHWQPREALTAVKRLVSMAHDRGVSVEAEVGALPDATLVGIDESQSHLTDPEVAQKFVEQTGIDALAVAIGNVHLLLRGTTQIDLDLLADIRRRTSVPLVMHGGTGFPQEAVGPSIERGVAKFNVGTVLKQSFFNAVRDASVTAAEATSVHDLLGSHRRSDVLVAGQKAMSAKVQELMRLYGSSGQATPLGVHAMSPTTV